MTGSADNEAATSRREIAWAAPILFGDEEAFVARAIKSTMISGGEFVDAFEQDFASMHGHRSAAVTTTNGTTAIELAYLALGIGAGDEVIVPGWSFMAAANTALAVGAKPVFADVCADDWLIDPEAVERCISSRTKAIVAIHTYGNVCDVHRLSVLARSAGVALIEDCAESLGSRRSGRMCGTFGDAATYSFQATKSITCGEGGAVLFGDPDVEARARLIRNHGMAGRRRYWHHVVGHNFRLSNLHCAFLCAQLKHWRTIVQQRVDLHQRYAAHFGSLSGSALQRFADDVEPVVWATGLRLLGRSAAERDSVIEAMRDRGIDCRPGFYAPSAQPLYNAAPIGLSEGIADQVIVPPIQGDLDEATVIHISQTLVNSIETLRAPARARSQG
jgi:perosamine synthetase